MNCSIYWLVLIGGCMKTVTMGSEQARLAWGQTLDTAFAGGEVVIQRHNRPVATLIGHAQLKELRTRLAMLELEKEADAALARIEEDPIGNTTDARYLCEQYGLSLDPEATSTTTPD